MESLIINGAIESKKLPDPSIYLEFGACVLFFCIRVTYWNFIFFFNSQTTLPMLPFSMVVQMLPVRNGFATEDGCPTSFTAFPL